MPTTSPEVPENLSFPKCTYIQLALPQNSNEGRVLSPSHIQLDSPGWKVQLEKVLSPPLGATQALVEFSQGKHIPFQENMFLPLRRHNTERIWMILWDTIAKHRFIFHCFLSITLTLPSVVGQQGLQKRNMSEAVLRRLDRRQKRKESPLCGKTTLKSTYKHNKVQDRQTRD